MTLISSVGILSWKQPKTFFILGENVKVSCRRYPPHYLFSGTISSTTPVNTHSWASKTITYTSWNTNSRASITLNLPEPSPTDMRSNRSTTSSKSNELQNRVLVYELELYKYDTHETTNFPVFKFYSSWFSEIIIIPSYKLELIY